MGRGRKEEGVVREEGKEGRGEGGEGSDGGEWKEGQQEEGEGRKAGGGAACPGQRHPPTPPMHSSPPPGGGTRASPTREKASGPTAPRWSKGTSERRDSARPSPTNLPPNLPGCLVPIFLPRVPRPQSEMSPHAQQALTPIGLKAPPPELNATSASHGHQHRNSRVP